MKNNIKWIDKKEWDLSKIYCHKKKMILSFFGKRVTGLCEKGDEVTKEEWKLFNKFYKQKFPDNYKILNETNVINE